MTWKRAIEIRAGAHAFEARSGVQHRLRLRRCRHARGHGQHGEGEPRRDGQFPARHLHGARSHFPGGGRGAGRARGHPLAEIDTARCVEPKQFHDGGLLQPLRRVPPGGGPLRPRAGLFLRGRGHRPRRRDRGARPPRRTCSCRRRGLIFPRPGPATTGAARPHQNKPFQRIITWQRIKCWPAENRLNVAGAALAALSLATAPALARDTVKIAFIGPLSSAAISPPARRPQFRVAGRGPAQRQARRQIHLRARALRRRVQAERGRAGGHQGGLRQVHHRRHHPLLLGRRHRHGGHLQPLRPAGGGVGRGAAGNHLRQRLQGNFTASTAR